MKHGRVLRGSGLSILGLVVAAGACGDDRTHFPKSGGDFDLDASTPDAGQECTHQCSLDGRSILDSCTGDLVEACPQDLACGAAVCQEPCAAAAADRSSNGCEFYFQLPLFGDPRIPQSCLAAFIVNTSTEPAEVSLEYDGRALDLSKSLFRTNPGDASLSPVAGPIPPGESAILFVSDRPLSAIGDSYSEHFHRPCPAGTEPALSAVIPTIATAIAPSFHLKSNKPVGTVSMYPFGGAHSFTPTAALLFPVPAWGKEHIIVNGWEAVGGGSPAAQIVASEDGTEVTIVPTTAIQGTPTVPGTLAGVPVTYNLDKGQYLQLVQSEELSGSIVSSTKPTTVFGGHSCAYVPSNSGAGDVLAQQLPPFEQWGNEYVGVAYRPRLGSESEPVPYRIVAARDGTRLDYDPHVPPGAPVTMSAGEVVTFSSGTGDAFVVRTQDVDHPIYLSAYMTGGDGVGRTSYGGLGDPEWVNVVPAAQYLSSYSFYADPTFEETSLVIVRASTRGEFKEVWLECAGNLTDFRPIGTRGRYEFVRVDLSRNGGPGEKFGDGVCRTGLQRMRSEGPFTATLWGFDVYASYAYPGGMAQRKLVETPLGIVR